MERKEKIELAIKKGFRYDPITGKIKNRFGKIISRKQQGYISFVVYGDKQYKILAHQFAWYIMNEEIVDCIDHVNNIKDDNRICNLRSVTHQENQWNKINNFRGYDFIKSKNKWKARIFVNKELIILGYFDTEEEAKETYNKAKITHHKI